MLGGTVVLFQLENLQIRVGVFKIQYVADVGSAKRVYALGIIAHNTKTVVLFCELGHNDMLCEIGVLILVDKYVSEKILIMAQHIGIVSQKQIGVV